MSSLVVTSPLSLEEALAEYVRAFNPPHEVRRAVIRRLKDASSTEDERASRLRRRQLSGQLERLKDLYVIGDLSKSDYEIKRNVLEGELEASHPRAVVDLTAAAAALTNFSLFWEREKSPGERNNLLRHIFESVSVNGDQLVAVTPREAFLPYFHFGADGVWEQRERRDSNPRPPA